MIKQTNEVTLKETLLGESLLFGLIGRALYNQPDENWLRTLLTENVFAEAPFSTEQPDTKRGQEILQNWTRNNRDFSDGEFKDLMADYTRLFVGVGKVLAPPWESVYFNEDRMIFQKQTLEVRNWYRRYGLEAEYLHREPDDHIGLEMSFIAYMAELSIKALEEQDEERYQLLKDAKRQFLSEHLLQWAPAWCAKIKENAKTDFYRGLGYLTMGALLAIANQYNVQMPKEVARELA